MAQTRTFTPETCRRIVEAVRQGNYLETAAAAAGISRETLRRWLNAGRADPEGPYGEFATDIATAEAAAEEASVQVILEASQRTWQAAAWFLERKHPGRWARAANAPVQAETTRGEAVRRGPDALEDADGWVNQASEAARAAKTAAH